MPGSPWSWIVLAYAVAAIPVGLLLGLARGVDLREVGSGNIGATNAVRALGKAWGSFVLLLDVLKAALPVWLATTDAELVGRPDADTWIAAVAFAAVCGHIYPVYLRFRGGKGVACALGTLLVLHWPAALLALALYALALALFRVSALGSLSAVTGASVFIVVTDTPTAYNVFVVALTLVIWWRHRENIGEIRERRAQADRTST
jgi:glycerol-3-phosphate acyltransferase PlsY